MEGAGGSDIETTSPAMGTWADVLALPPLPRPDFCAMRSEACCGNSLVLFLIFLFVAPMQAHASGKDAASISMVARMWIMAIYAEAAIAITCLIGLMWGDPGTVKRSPETCFPQPEIISERLRTGQSLSGVGNVHEDGRVFCCRCLVWRPDDSDVHHCATCQRCVKGTRRAHAYQHQHEPLCPFSATAPQPILLHSLSERASRPLPSQSLTTTAASSAGASLATVAEATWGTSRRSS